MKTLKYAIVILMTAAVLIGCSSEKPVEEGSSSAVEVESSESSESSSEVESENILETILPDPSELYPDYNVKMLPSPGGDSYQFMIEKADETMFREYIEATKEAGFSDVGTDVENLFQAHSADGMYWTSIYFFPGDAETDSYVYPTVQYAVTDEEEETK